MPRKARLSSAPPVSKSAIAVNIENRLIDAVDDELSIDKPARRRAVLGLAGSLAQRVEDGSEPFPPGHAPRRNWLAAGNGSRYDIKRPPHGLAPAAAAQSATARRRSPWLGADRRGSELTHDRSGAGGVVDPLRMECDKFLFATGTKFRYS
jgi:hypothetical protein